MSAEVPTSLPEPDSWIEHLLAHVEEHAHGEQEALEAYRRIASESPDGHIRYVFSMIEEDERKHHRWFHELANTIRSDISGQAVEPRIPPGGVPQDRKALLEAVDRLLAFEREDLEQLKSLREEIRPVKGTTIWALLVDVMEMDTRKHIRMLEFVRRLAKADG